MANTDIVNLIISTTSSAITYLLPVIAIMTVIVFLFTFLISVTIGTANRTFKG